MRFNMRKIALAALLAGAPGLVFAADDWQAQVAEALGKTGAIAKAEKITDADDLKAATAQKAAMAKATVSLLAAADAAVKSQCRPACSEHLSAAAERSCRGRGNPAARDGFEEGDGKA